jgi:hypothetical protein
LIRGIFSGFFQREIIMEMTIIGVYDDASHALSARNDLIASGFTRRNVQLNPDPDLSPMTGKVPQDSSVSAGISNFFRSLFGVGDKSTHSHLYAEAVRRGSSVVTVDIDAEEQRTRAEEIMQRHLPVDLEERSADWIRHGWRGHDPNAPMMSREEILRERHQRLAAQKDQQSAGSAVRAVRREKDTPSQNGG